jgi:hypothetical protein
LFDETYKSCIEGRTATDPIEDWYNGELGFFDFYIILLSKRLKECGANLSKAQATAVQEYEDENINLNIGPIYVCSVVYFTCLK